ncbi:MAG: hypothetical protein Tp166SUR375021_41 [Prokaryotic dsDNA virus sp.]|nr:MAG: hypothetical protein Tp166SUR375021_41 [Prokaryotic dsDNA virus sp.]
MSGNSNIGSSIKKISDGDGNEANLYLSTTQTLVGAGSVSVPSLAIFGSTTTGLYSPNSAQLGISIAGSQKALFYSGGLTLTGDISVSGGFKDSNNTFGTSGQVLASTGSGTDWVNLSEISGIDGSGTLNTIPKFTPDGNTIGDSTITDDGTDVTITANVKLGDSKILNIGTGNDLQIYHNGTDTYLHNDEGNLIIEQDKVDHDIIFKNDDQSGGLTTYFNVDGGYGLTEFYRNLRMKDNIVFEIGDHADGYLRYNSTTNIIDFWTPAGMEMVTNATIKIRTGADETIATFTRDGSVDLYYDNSKQFETTSAGIKLPTYTAGFLTTDADGDVILDTNTYLNTTGGTLTGILKLNDNVRLDFGSDSDLRIHHSGSAGTISNLTGDLTIQNSANDSDIIFKSDDGSGAMTTYLEIDGTSGENVFYKPTGHRDNVIANWGNSNDLKIYHDGTDSVIQNETGDLELQNRQNDGDIKFKSDDGSGGVATYFTVDGGNEANLFSKNVKLSDSVELRIGSSNDLKIYHDGGTSSYINNYTGHLYFRNYADDSDIYFQSDNGSGGLTNYFYLDGSITRTIFPQDTKHEDNVKAFFGNSYDLEIYHDGSHSYIADTGTGELRLRSDGISIQSANGNEYMAFFAGTGGQTVSLYAGNSVKFQTTSAGIKLPSYGAGYLKTDSDGNVSVDSSTIEDTLQTVTDRGATTTNSILIGKTSSSISTAGIELHPNGVGNFTRDSIIAQFNRTSTHGDVINILKDGSTVGVIGTQNWGIGETSPDTQLHISGADDVYITLESTDASTTEEVAIKYQNQSTGTNFWWAGLNQQEHYSLAYGTSFSGSTTKLTVGTDGVITFNDYGAGYLKTDANGVISVDTSTIEDTLQTVTDRGSTTTNTMQGTRLGLGGAPHASAALQITTTAQHLRMYNGSELGVMHVLSGGELELWAHGNDETINFRTGSGSGVLAAHIDGIDTTFEGDVTINSDNLTLSTNASIPLLSLETSHASGIPIVNLKGAASSQVRYQDENGTIQSRIDLLDGGAFSFIDVTSSTTHLGIDSSGNATFVGNILGSSTDFKIGANTSDGSDNAQLKIMGGGDATDTRGASIHLAGNEHGNAGLLQLRAGDGATGGIRLYEGGSERMRITAGKVSIGVGIPQEKLHVYNAGTARIEVEGTTGPAAFKATNSQGSFGWYVPSDANEFRLWNFGTSADLVEVDASGNTIVAGYLGVDNIKSDTTNGVQFLTTGNSAQFIRTKAIQVSTSYGGTPPTQGILFGTDTNLYRDSSNVLKTDDSLIVAGDLTVQGTTTTIDTTNLDVKDKNITLNYGSGDTSANANGAGITIQDAVNATTDATITWNATSDSFNFSNSVNVTGGITSTSNNSYTGGMSSFETTLTNNDDWQNSPISILERANIGTGSTADKYAPNLNFHWGGIVSRSLWMDASGNLNYGEYSSTGSPGYSNGFIRSHEMHAGVFKDKDSTGYYLDPANTGTSLNVAGAGTFAGVVNMASGKITSDGSADAGAYLELKHANNNSTDVCATINLTNNAGGYAAIVGGTTGANNTGYIEFKTDNAGTQGTVLTLNGDNSASFAGKVSVGGGDTSTAQVALKGQQSLLSFIRGTSGDSTFFMSSDSARLYFSHTDITTPNVIFKIDSSDKSATFYGQVTINPDADSQVIIGNGGTNASTVFAGTGDDLYIGGGASSNMRIFDGTAVQFYGTVDIDSTLNVDGNAAFGGDVDVTRSSTGQILSRVYNSNTSGTGTSVLRIANGGNQANGARLEFSDLNYYNATISVDRTNGMRFMVHDDSNSMADLLTHTVLTLATNKNATFAGDVSVEGDGSDFFVKSADYTIARIIPRGSGSAVDKGLFSLMDDGTEDVRIDTGGNSWINTGYNLGLGTVSPQSNLHISTSTTNSAIRLQNDNGSGSTANYVLQTDSQGLGVNGFGIYDVANTAYRLVIDGDGSVGIGLDNPSIKLDILGTATNWTARVKNYTDGGYGLQVDNSGANASTTYAFAVYDAAGGANFFIRNDGLASLGITPYATAANARLQLPSHALAIKNNVSGSNNNWSYVRNTATGNQANLEFTTGVGISLTLNHDKSATFAGNVTVPALVATQDIYLNDGYSAANRYFHLRKNTANDGGIIMSSKTGSNNATNDWQIVNYGGNRDLIFYAYGLGASALTLDRENGNATFAGNVGIKSAPVGNAGTNIISVGTAGSVAGGVQLWAGTGQSHFLQFGDESGTASNHYRGAVGYAHGSDTLSLIQGSVTALSFTGSQAATFAGNINSFGTTNTYSSVLGRHPIHTAYGGLWNTKGQANETARYMILNAADADGYRTYINGDELYLRAGVNSTTGQVVVRTTGTTFAGEIIGNTIKPNSADLDIKLVSTSQDLRIYDGNNAVTARIKGNGTGAIFAGAVTATSVKATDFMNVMADDAEIYWTIAANNDYWRWRRDASDNFILDHYDGSSTGTALTFDGSQNATFGGTVRAEDRFDLYDGSHVYQLRNSSGAFDIRNGNSGVIPLAIDSSSNVTFAGTVTFNDHTLYGDQVKARFGAGGDLEIYHDASSSFINNNTGHLYIRNYADDSDIYFQSDNGSGALANYFYIDGGIGETVFARNTQHLDSVYAQFGTGNDLKIYHNGTNSFIENGTGYLMMRSDTALYLRSYTGNQQYITCTKGGSVDLFHNDSKKLHTLSTGVNVIGGISASATSSITCDGTTKALGVSNVGTTSDPTMEIKTSGTASGASSLDIYQVNTIYGPSAIQFFYGSTSSTAVGSIRAASSSTTYNTSSDYRLKENITDLSNALERVDNLEPKRFNFKNTPDVVVDGFLAHEAQEVVPQAVSGEKDAEIDGKPSYQGIDHSMIVPLLTAAIKELKTQNEELLARIEALENN